MAVCRLDLGGAEMLECRLAAEACRAGTEVHLLAQYSEQMEGQAEGARRWLAAGVAGVHWLGMDSKAGRALAPLRLSRIVNRHRFDALITTNIGTDMCAVIARPLMRTAHVVAMHGTGIYRSSSHVLRVRLRNRMIRSADAFYAVSNYMRDESIRNLGLPDGRNFVVYNSIAPDAQSKEADIRSIASIPSSARVILAAGRVHYSKGFDIALKAVAPLLRESDSYLLISGFLPPENALGVGAHGFDQVVRQVGMEHGVADRIRFLGHRSDLRSLMRTADVLIHTVREEAFGLVLLEAIEARLPIVASNAGGIPELLAGAPYKMMNLSDMEGIRTSVRHWLTCSKEERHAAVNEAAKILPRFRDDRRVAEVLGVCQFAINRRAR